MDTAPRAPITGRGGAGFRGQHHSRPDPIPQDILDDLRLLPSLDPLADSESDDLADFKLPDQQAASIESLIDAFRISHGAFELRMDNVWLCKVLLLFQVESNTELGLKRHSCAFVTVLEEYSGPRRPGNFNDYLLNLEHLYNLDYINYLDHNCT